MRVASLKVSKWPFLVIISHHLSQRQSCFLLSGLFPLTWLLLVSPKIVSGKSRTLQQRNFFFFFLWLPFVTIHPKLGLILLKILPSYSFLSWFSICNIWKGLLFIPCIPKVPYDVYSLSYRFPMTSKQRVMTAKTLKRYLLALVEGSFSLIFCLTLSPPFIGILGKTLVYSPYMLMGSMAMYIVAKWINHDKYLHYLA